MVEAPGYCPPGPKCLFHATVYRHSRVAPAGPKIGICRRIRKGSTSVPEASKGWHFRPHCCYGGCRRPTILGGKRMKRLVFAVSGTAALALAACSGNNQDAVNNVEMNQPATDLNALSNDAAKDAANARAGRARQPGSSSSRTENADNTAQTADATTSQRAERQRHVTPRPAWIEGPSGARSGGFFFARATPSAARDERRRHSRRDPDRRPRRGRPVRPNC